VGTLHEVDNARRCDDDFRTAAHQQCVVVEFPELPRLGHRAEGARHYPAMLGQDFDLVERLLRADVGERERGQRCQIDRLEVWQDDEADPLHRTTCDVSKSTLNDMSAIRKPA
jgi:hypothetical protein